MTTADDAFWMQKALEQAKLAMEQGEFPVGSVITDGIRVLAKGARLGTANGGLDEIDHAEMVALRQLSEGVTTLGQDLSSLILYSTLEPCLMCLGAIMVSGIGRVVYACEDVMGGGTRIVRQDLAPLYRNARLDIRPYVLRKESLTLLQQFFKRPQNHYWNDSLLANYILKQPL